MNCQWEEFDAPDGRGWRRVRCRRCGLVTGRTPHTIDRIHGTCPLPGFGDHLEFVLSTWFGIGLESIAYTALACRFAWVLLKSYVARPDCKTGTCLAWVISRVVSAYRVEDCGDCRKRIETMDSGGQAWCSANVPEIVGWLKESAEKRQLPFAPWAAKILVLRAIAISRS